VNVPISEPAVRSVGASYAVNASLFSTLLLGLHLLPFLTEG
jgi:hypothetical protein